MEFHNAIPLPDNSIHEKKNSIRVPQEKCTFKETRGRKKRKSSSEEGYFSYRLCVLNCPK